MICFSTDRAGGRAGGLATAATGRCGAPILVLITRDSHVRANSSFRSCMPSTTAPHSFHEYCLSFSKA
eukprot:7424030-Lingulodinium_polyedra.AAC.1